MILTTHAITGAAVASLNPTRPISGFFAGVVLHFILDAIPHWEYRIHSDSINPGIGSTFVFDRDLFGDVLRIGSDMSLGIILSLALFYSPQSAFAVLAGALGGVTPDALQFVYGRVRRGPIVYLQKFHEWIHSPYKKLRHMPVLGVPLQILIVAIIILLVYTYHGRFL